MRSSKILKRLREGKPARLAMLGHFVPAFIAHAAANGYDGIWLDLEHRAFDPREVQALLALFHLYDIDALVRPPTREHTALYRYLEDGASGLVIPLVHTADEARDLVRKTKFPPLGDRGTNGWGLETNYAIDTGGKRDALIAHALRETFLLLQVESPEAIRNIDAIAQVPGVDGFFVGPEDFRIRLQAEAATDMTYDSAMDRLAETCRRRGKAWGTLATSTNELRDWHMRGANLLLWGNEIAIIRDALAKHAEALNEYE